MAVYTGPGRHPRLSTARAFGWVVALDKAGREAEVLVECGHGLTGNLPRDGLWTVDLSAVTSFESNHRAAQAEAAVDLGRRAAVKPRMVAALTRNIDLDLLSSFPTARIPRSWSPQFDRTEL